MASRILKELLLAFFTALGVVLGGALLGCLAAFFTRGSPLSLLRELSRAFRLWAILVAIGGTFPTIRVLESGLFFGQTGALLRQFGIITSAMVGAYLGYWLLITATGGE